MKLVARAARVLMNNASYRSSLLDEGVVRFAEQNVLHHLAGGVAGESIALELPT